MAGLINPFNHLLGRLLLAFWLTSTLTLGAVIGLPMLQKQLGNQPVDAPLQLLLEGIAERLNQQPTLTIDHINRVIQRRGVSMGPLPKDMLDALGRPPHQQHRPAPPRDQPRFKTNTPPMRLQLYLVDANGNVLNRPAHRLPRALREFLLDFDPQEPMRQQQLGDHLLFGPKQLDNGNYLIGKMGSIRKLWLLELLQRPWLLLLITTLFSTLVFGLLAWNLSKPLRQLRATSSAIARGELDARISPRISNRGDEIGQLGKSFNRMADSVATMVTGQQRLLSDISHELRTPLTRLQLSLALARRKGQQSTELDRITLEAEQLESMLQELLALSRLNLQVTERKSPLDLIETLQPVLDGAEFEAAELGKMMVITAPAQLPFTGIDTLLQRLLENPLRNALRYARSQVHITLRDGQDQLELLIEDDGPGVPADQLDAIFKPFHRVDDARDRDSGGWGLGLAISLGAVEAHQGTLHAYNRNNGGLAVLICLPKPQA
ncbi:ATP-binding protein [uncultured Ferrimonas sp.]|uniref:ATP-binding protein n=1 Tax=uncultured Ferrimonas sp. TaxID=432640 RepID=UPI00261CA26B|nr:ATP-binding protein [uncultured Ferrimonas sp.]